MEEIKKSCKNCKYYFQHYGWIYDSFHPINFAHCLKHVKKGFPFDNGCALWEHNAEKIKRKKQALKERLLEMAEKINFIAMRLENDDYNNDLN